MFITRVFRIAEADLAIQSIAWQLQLRAHPPNGSWGLPSKQRQFLVVGGGGVRKMGVGPRIGFCSIKNVAHLRAQSGYEFRFYLVLLVGSLNFYSNF
jgi:hypothetical protein